MSFFRKIFGPFPYFTVEKELHSGIHDKPEWIYYVWVHFSFSRFRIAGSTKKEREVQEIIDNWTEALNSGEST